MIVLGSLALGWSPNFDVLVAIPALRVGDAHVRVVWSLDGRQLHAEITLAVANAGFILLMLVSGMVIPVSKLPGVMRTVSEALPSEALSHVQAVGTGAAAGTPCMGRARGVGRRRPGAGGQVLPLGVIP